MPDAPLAALADGSDHTVGSADCDMCWGDEAEPCDDCPGFVHSEYLDESHDAVYLIRQCDVCGETGQG